MSDTRLTRDAEDGPVRDRPDGRPTSRDSTAGAGWGGPATSRRPRSPQPGSYVELLKQRIDPPAKPFSWISVDAFRKASNDFWSARVRTGIIDDERARRVAAQRAAGVERDFPDFVVDRTELEEPSFVLIGDPGEGDESQYAVVAPLLAAAGSTDFMVVCSDVIYPAGDVNDYVDKFYVPYQGYGQTIYALPGNHDWFDLLDGFMFAFCGAEPLPPSHFRGASYTRRDRIARKMWRRSSRPNRPLLTALRNERPPWRDGPPKAPQPGPYFAIDTGPVRLVCIDTGVKNVIDREQAEWLMRVSAGDKPKVLLTGRPIYVDYEYEPGKLTWGDDKLLERRGEDPPPERPATVDDVVRRIEHNYVAVIGGDTHNYQRYPVQVGDRTIQYVVSGGGGAYMHETHAIDPREKPEVPAGVTFPEEDEVRLYPLRGDSLAMYAPRVITWLRSTLTLWVAALLGGLSGGDGRSGWMGTGKWAAFAVVAAYTVFSGLWVLHLLQLGAHRTLFARGDLARGRISPDVAARFIRRALRAHSGARGRTRAVRRRADGEGPRRGRARWRCAAARSTRSSPSCSTRTSPRSSSTSCAARWSTDRLRVECFGVTGWRDDEHDPPLEDVFEIELRATVYRAISPRSERAITSRWISLVPSYISVTFASRK